MRRALVPLIALLTAAAALAAPPAAKPQKAKPATRMEFRPAELELSPGETYPVELFIPNRSRKPAVTTLSYAPKADVLPDARWTGKIGRYGVKTWPKIHLSSQAKGEIPITASAGKFGEAQLLIKVSEPSLKVIPGLFKLTVIVRNSFQNRKLKGRLIASNPDRFLQDITTREFMIPPGHQQTLVFPLPGAAPADGETYDFTFQVQSYAGYRATRKYSLKFPPHQRPLK